jgi:hypothetical protein
VIVSCVYVVWRYGERVVCVCLVAIVLCGNRADPISMWRSCRVCMWCDDCVMCVCRVAIVSCVYVVWRCVVYRVCRPSHMCMSCGDRMDPIRLYRVWRYDTDMAIVSCMPIVLCRIAIVSCMPIAVCVSRGRSCDVWWVIVSCMPMWRLCCVCRCGDPMLML